MKSLSFLFFLFLFSTEYAQEKLLQFEIGLNQSWFNYELEILNDYKPEIKPQLTLGMNYKVYSKYGFALTTGLRYHDLFRY
jgi:hypothetical protein